MATAQAPSTKPAEPDDIRFVKKHHKIAYKLISDALSKDNKGDFPGALKQYQAGEEELLIALSASLKGEGKEWDKARDLQKKIKKNLAEVTDRIDVLKEEIKPAFLRMNSHPKPTNPKSKAKDKTRARSAEPRPKATSATAKPATKPAAGKTPSAKRPPAEAAEPERSSKKKSNHLANIDTKMADMILNEIVQTDTHVTMDDVVGMENAKRILHEVVVLPALRPDLMSGLRAPAKGLLLFGPPGNGKTMLAKALANESKAKFFSVSASSLTSRYLGDGEKLVRALFAMARELAPSIVFIDEIDSLLTARSSNEHEASRRLKTELLVQMDGVRSQSDERILVLGATNLPHEIDEAALRRMPERVYIPLPTSDTRVALLNSLLKKVKSNFSKSEMSELAQLTAGYSGSDLTNLARDAAMQPIRELGSKVADIPMDKVRAVALKDFKVAMSHIRPSVKPETLSTLEEWNRSYGCK